MKSNIYKYNLHQKIKYMEDNKGWWFISKRNIITSIIIKYQPTKRNLRILDIGCGTGFILEGLKNVGSLYGIDIDSRTVKICNEKGLTGVIKGNILKIPYNDNTFDIVITIDVLEHIDNDIKAVSECFRVLKKQGILIIHVPSDMIPWSRLDKDFGHKRRYNKSDLTNLLSFKFKILKITYTNFFLYFPILFIRLLQNNFSKEIVFDATGMKILPFPLEYFFKLLFKNESFLIKLINLPIGTSLLAVAKKE